MLLLTGTLAAAAVLLAQPAAAASLVPTMLALRTATAFDGIYTTPAGETVHISVSDRLAPDETENQRWADFLGSVPHGAELELLNLYIAPPLEVSLLCGIEALACYYPDRERIVFPSEETPGEPARESILAHEYGHHIARNRLNPPWQGSSHGTKRWASYENVCSRLRTGALSLDDYAFDPGEGFAESYRVLVERRLGLQQTPWQILSRRLEPDDRALALLERDVSDPWQANTVVRFRGAGTRNIRFSTPLDGRVTLSLRGPRTAVYQLELPGQPRRLARGQGAVRSSTTVCGRRQISATVEKVSGGGPFQLLVSRP